MRRQRPTPTRRTWRAPRTTSPTGGARSGRRAAPRGMPFAGARGRRATSPGRFGSVGPGRRPAVGRGKQSSGKSAMALGRGLLGALGNRKQSKGSRKGPALLTALAGLGAAGAAGAAALKRRRSGEDQPTGHVAPSEPAAPPSSTAEEAGPPAGAT